MIILSLAENYGWDLQQFDVKNVFLRGDLEEEIYTEVLPGYCSQFCLQVEKGFIWVETIPLSMV